DANLKRFAEPKCADVGDGHQAQTEKQAAPFCVHGAMMTKRPVSATATEDAVRLQRSRWNLPEPSECPARRWFAAAHWLNSNLFMRSLASPPTAQCLRETPSASESGQKPL